MLKDVIKSLIAIRQNEIPFEVIDRDIKLPVNRKKIITIPGVRRCGKSTLMMLAINDLVAGGVSRDHVLWLGFDDERLVSLSAEDLDIVVTSYMEMYPDIPIGDVYMFFDEIQLIRNWEYFVLRVFKNYCKNIYICGSNATMLSTELCSALRGYPLEYPTFPLSFNEYCRFKGVKTDSYLEQDKARLRTTFEEFNHSSAFPEVVLSNSKSEQIKMLQGYFDTMLLKDLAEHYKIGNTEVVRYFVKRIMGNLTKPTSVNSIYNDIRSQGLKVTKNDLYQWANYICDIFMFVRIPRFEHSLVKERNSLFKYYCIDNGMRNALLLPQSNDNGKYLENTVFLQLNRTKDATDKISYFQGRGECDFVIQREDSVVQLLQVSWSMADSETHAREIKGLLEASAATGCDRLYVITNDEEGVETFDGKCVYILPAWKWLLGASDKY